MSSVFLRLAVLLCCLFCASCSNSNEAFEVQSYTDTVRSQSMFRMSSVEWTAEMDNTLAPKTADESLPEMRSIDFPAGLCAAGGTAAAPLYPKRDGFGSLDVSLLTAAEYTLIESFCTSFAAGNIGTSLFSAEHQWFVPVFKLETAGFPDVSSWLIGKPYVLSDSMEAAGITGESDALSDSAGLRRLEIPVRFYFNESYCDMTVFISGTSDGNCKIEQISTGAILNE